MYDFLNDLTVVEAASFIAGPSCALHLNQFGAKVIRLDMIGGGPDFRRWPVSENGQSYYWEGLNKGKLSVAVDLSRPEGRELAAQIITAPGPGRGLFVTNYPRKGFLSHEALAARRADLVTLRIMGWPDGRNGVDYTVNAAVGVPLMTGAEGAEDPVNSVLPAWDLLAGAYGAFALLAAERKRHATGIGQEVTLALSDLAIGSLGNLGQIAEVLAGGDRPRAGNALYGAYGRDFHTSDGCRIMIAAITPRQWRGLLRALGVEERIATLQQSLGVDFLVDQGQRHRHRHALDPVISTAVAQRTLADLGPALDREAVCWEPYRSLAEAVTDGPRMVSANPIFTVMRHVSGAEYPAAGALAEARGETRQPPQPASVLGADTEQVLAEHLGLGSGQIAALVDRGVVATA
ncbi:MAG: carnitine dehydratase [Paracoccus sp. BP8]|nr:MAG: carnitine dehydratase [Paracoccus sp. BP8]